MVNDVERVQAGFAGLCEPLHDAFAWAEAMRRVRLKELASRSEYTWLATHTVRGFAHLRLQDMDLGPWCLAGNHASNGALWLTDGEYRARILHAASDSDVPAPGVNYARRAFYRNTPLPLQDTLMGPANDRLLILWTTDPEDGAPSFRVVRPIGNWKWGTRAITDLDFVLPRYAEELADLRFEPSDEGLDLFVPNEEEGDAGGLPG
ncbi:hypothetical protein [Embleya sp. NPDC059259]|uniref:hypothetical protein n=1 Tax=unclassified Embleya TaxID=2699296 RepID=UPI0036C4D26A